MPYEFAYPDELHAVFNNEKWLGIENTAAMCEDTSSGKYGPTFVSYRCLDPDVPNMQPLLESLVNTYSDEIRNDLWPPKRAA